MVMLMLGICIEPTIGEAGTGRRKCARSLAWSIELSLSVLINSECKCKKLLYPNISRCKCVRSGTYRFAVRAAGASALCKAAKAFCSTKILAPLPNKSKRELTMTSFCQVC